jgi:hypothetical protein
MAGRSWGGWRLNKANRTLEIDAYGTPRQPYYVDLDRCRTPAEVLDRIAQVSAKAWCTPVVRSGLVVALDEILLLQANLCGDGQPREITQAEIKQRVAEVF